jgi:4-amino-4-deoxy-L-arabinose transferase-like glycosyltransferase
MLDVSVTLFVTLTIYFFIRARESGRRLDWALVGVMAGLGVMTKDIVGLLGLGVVVIFSLLDIFWLKNRGPYQDRRRLLLVAFCFLAVALPWHLAMTIKWGTAFWDVYFVGHVFGRAFTDAQGKTQPLLWYLTVIKVGYRVWAIPAAAGLLLVLTKVIKKDWRYLLLAVWLVVIFTFFSISRSKLIWYLIPIYPVLAVIAGRFLERITYALTIMYSSLTSPTVIRVTAAFVVFIVSLNYVYIMRDRVYYPDFNLHIYELFKAKDAKFGIDRTVYYEGLADPAVMYISQGPVSSVTKGNIEEIGSRKDPATFIMSQDLYKYFKKDGLNFNEVVEWGGFSLVDKPRTP